MKVYPVLWVGYDYQGGAEPGVIVEVFDSYDAAYNYAVMLAESALKYGHVIPGFKQNKVVDIDARKLNGYIHTLDENNRVVDEYTIWAETVRTKGWHA